MRAPLVSQTGLDLETVTQNAVRFEDEGQGARWIAVKVGIVSVHH